MKTNILTIIFPTGWFLWESMRWLQQRKQSIKDQFPTFSEEWEHQKQQEQWLVRIKVN